MKCTSSVARYDNRNIQSFSNLIGHISIIRGSSCSLLHFAFHYLRKKRLKTRRIRAEVIYTYTHTHTHTHTKHTQHTHTHTHTHIYSIYYILYILYMQDVSGSSYFFPFEGFLDKSRFPVTVLINSN